MAVASIPKSSPMSSANESNDLSNDFTSMRHNIKELLKSRIFLGRYLERRLVDNIGYRDVVLVSAAETELKVRLLEAKSVLFSIRPQQWVGITDTDKLGYAKPGVCIWTEIEYEPFGAFWFQIKTVSYRDQEVIIKVKCLRHITDAYLELEPLLTQGTKAEVDMKTNAMPAIKIDEETVNDIIITLKSALSIKNLKDVVTFFFALVMVIFTGGIEFIYFLGNFVLALVRESSVFVTNATPFFLGVLDFLSKIVGGFYILLAMIFRQNTPPPIRNNRKITYYPNDNLHTNPNHFSTQNQFQQDRDFD